MLEPFLKWPGGKRWLVQRYSHLFPTNFGRYIEPFLGSGAVFFHLLPRRAILSDSNPELVNTYRCLKQDAAEINRRLKNLHGRHCSLLYYRVRDERPNDPVAKAVRFIYLNRTCFNGIYRVNRKGIFNVPMGSKGLVEYPSGFLEQISRSLKDISIKHSDFEVILDDATEGDFAFVDPPYTVMHNSNNFRKYNSSLFSWTDQVRLASAIKRAASRGTLIMLANADHKSVRDLYGGFGFHHRISRASVLAADAEHRRKTTELLVTSFETTNSLSASPLNQSEDDHGSRR